MVVRLTLGVPFGSDAYSYLAWGRGLVEHGTTGHAAYDFTVPKPLLLGVASLGELVRAPLAVFGLWTVLAQAGAVAAAGLLARRLAGPIGGIAGAVLALALPVLWRGGLAGDSNVPYAALVVGAAAAGAATPAASGLLGLAGLVRPEAWGLAALSALLGWPEADRRERGLAVAAVVVPPVVWLGLDRLATGDALWSSHVVDRYLDEFGLSPLGLLDLPEAVWDRVGDVTGWPVALLGLAALVAGLRRMPRDAAVVFPLALVAACSSRSRSGSSPPTCSAGSSPRSRSSPRPGRPRSWRASRPGPSWPRRASRSAWP